MRIVAGLATMIVAGVCLLTFANPVPKTVTCYDPLLEDIWAFEPPNPPSVAKRLKLYIWCEPTLIHWGEKISLYIERLATEKALFSPWSPMNEITQDLTVLRIKRGEWTVLLKDGIPHDGRKNPDKFCPPRLSPDEWMPKEHEIPYWRLHGRRLLTLKKDDCLVWVNPGDSFVRRIPDLTALFRTKKTPDGRVWVLCVKSVPSAYRPSVTKWLPVEGCYRLQWGCSNIIEFEIRQ